MVPKRLHFSNFKQDAFLNSLYKEIGIGMIFKGRKRFEKFKKSVEVATYLE